MDRVLGGGRLLMREGSPQAGATPLRIATEKGHVNFARVLLEAGADKNAMDTVRE